MDKIEQTRDNRKMKMITLPNERLGAYSINLYNSLEVRVGEVFLNLLVRRNSVTMCSETFFC